MTKLKLTKSHTALYVIGFLLSVTPLATAQKLIRGKDTIDVPAMKSGLCVHNLFQSNMVLQRDQPIRVWGWADAGKNVEVVFTSKKLSTRADKSGSWAVVFPAMKANSTPQKMTITCGNESVSIENILIGDVWLLGGQSNMEHPIARVEGGQLEIMSANYPNIRHLTIPQPNGPEHLMNFPRLMEWHGFFNTHYRKGYWDICQPDNVPELSAIGYIFAKRIHKASGVPIGIIDASRGGTCVETWIPSSIFKKINTPEVKDKLDQWEKKIAAYDPVKDLEGQKNNYRNRVKSMKKKGQKIPAHWKEPTEPRPSPALDMNRPGNCYASIISPIAGIKIKGTIWHQGYNNAMESNGHVMYYQVFDDMIASWRQAFGDPTMPFGIISLCTDGKPQTLDNYLEMTINEGIYIREVQYQTFLDFQKAGDKNIGFASSYDMRRSWYHPQLKIPVGERIARWALATQYGKNRLTWVPPVINSVKPNNGSLLLTFNAPVGCQKDDPIQGFAIAGEDRRFQPAKAEYLVIGKDANGRPKTDSRVLVLTSPHVSNPIHYRYAWGRNPMGNLKHQRVQDGPPLATQRSDNWPMNEVPVKFGEVIDRNVVNQARQAHRLFDAERRVMDAQLLLKTEKESTMKALDKWRK
ncbi:MAG: sialate O-acetylesterase [Akkermansiaceae bacterium]